MTYLDVPKRLVDDHLHEIKSLYSINEARVESVEVMLNTGSLHHQVLSNPRPKLLSYVLIQFGSLSNNEKG
jgi:hypothetical protein